MSRVFATVFLLLFPLLAMAEDWVRIVPVQIALRAGPGVRYDPVAVLYEDDESAVLERRGGWLRLAVRRDGRFVEGWIESAFTDPAEAPRADDLPRGWVVVPIDPRHGYDGRYGPGDAARDPPHRGGYRQDTDRYREETDRYRRDTDRYRAETDRYQRDADRYRNETDRYQRDADRYRQETDRYRPGTGGYGQHIGGDRPDTRGNWQAPAGDRQDMDRYR